MYEHPQLIVKPEQIICSVQYETRDLSLKLSVLKLLPWKQRFCNTKVPWLYNIFAIGSTVMSIISDKCCSYWGMFQWLFIYGFAFTWNWPWYSCSNIMHLTLGHNWGWYSYDGAVVLWGTTMHVSMYRKMTVQPNWLNLNLRLPISANESNYAKPNCFYLASIFIT